MGQRDRALEVSAVHLRPLLLNSKMLILISRFLEVFIQLFQLTLSDQSLKLKDIFKEAATSSI